MAKKKKSLWKYAAEALLIVFSVVLALALNEWREHVKEQHQVEQIRERIEAELSQNIALANQLVSVQGRLLNHLDSLQQNRAMLRRLATPTGINFDVLAPEGFGKEMTYVGTAWRIACSNGLASHFSIEEQECLTKTNDQQNLIFDYFNQYINYLSSINMHQLREPANLAMVIRQKTWQLRGMETRLLYQLQTALATMSRTDSLAGKQLPQITTRRPSVEQRVDQP